MFRDLDYLPCPHRELVQNAAGILGLMTVYGYDECFRILRNRVMQGYGLPADWIEILRKNGMSARELQLMGALKK